MDASSLSGITSSDFLSDNFFTNGAHAIVSSVDGDAEGPMTAALNLWAWACHGPWTSLCKVQASVLQARTPAPRTQSSQATSICPSTLPLVQRANASSQSLSAVLSKVMKLKTGMVCIQKEVQVLHKGLQMIKTGVQEALKSLHAQQELDMEVTMQVVKEKVQAAIQAAMKAGKRARKRTSNKMKEEGTDGDTKDNEKESSIISLAYETLMGCTTLRVLSLPLWPEDKDNWPLADKSNDEFGDKTLEMEEYEQDNGKGGKKTKKKYKQLAKGIWMQAQGKGKGKVQAQTMMDNLMVRAVQAVVERERQWCLWAPNH
ncbi:hypothetical protein CONPUDRAFT_73043 [Coniophora puteana RWD-64-598 SS2]|uniref:Uncharacterized protein n=1 Tax=Coniophora puteana (strain RWD-64-598) TaxID=741705 RepID=A0A5M3MQ39_CONPW|nr:uncharacterized protein CONPUDRAFT_73043 [Coniophora puteana RWD-64-598 SS2]EIW81263.1 hypothetical protein CONPUDRAFT_73043 [Coniophora puteana RWD-64-598 SS2]